VTAKDLGDNVKRHPELVFHYEAAADEHPRMVRVEQITITPPANQPPVLGVLP
jgi:hypothetical protein